MAETADEATRLQNQVRREQTRQLLAALERDLQAWLQHRRNQDRNGGGQYIGRHKTQLEALESVLLGALGDVRSELEKLSPDSAVGPFYDRCRDCDRALVWLQRLWDYFRQKFDQRDQEPAGALLRAADEVVWSCYRGVFARAQARRPALAQGPVPLPFVEPDYSPAARPAHNVPPTLHTDVDFLDDYLRILPVPLLQIPPWCVPAPWWLVFVGHEVGHYLIHDLGLVAYFKEGVGTAVAGKDLPKGLVTAWQLWAEEIFADVLSLLTMGHWALWSIVEVEWAAPEAMVRPRSRYPAPVIRLALMGKVAELLGLPAAKGLRGLDLQAIAAADQRAALDWTVLDDVAEFLLAALPDNLGTLAALTAFDTTAFALGGAVSLLSQRLRGAVPYALTAQLDTPRQVTAAAMQAWSEIAALSGASQRQQARDALATNARNDMIAGGEPGTRGDRQPSGHMPQAGSTLAKQLLQRAAEQRATAPAEED